MDTLELIPDIHRIRRITQECRQQVHAKALQDVYKLITTAASAGQNTAHYDLNGAVEGLYSFLSKSLENVGYNASTNYKILIISW